MIFISKGYEVFLYDVVAEQIDIALKCIEEKLKNLEKRKALRGELSAQNQFKLIHKASSLKECIENAIHVQVGWMSSIWIDYFFFINLFS